ncbi:MAG: hypothetical protein BGP01_03705 [Paludibacter sp. 47-17]|nr:MAG: hypothetical protein BGP01_03705 [Paludibacter sp. 47-17]
MIKIYSYLYKSHTFKIILYAIGSTLVVNIFFVILFMLFNVNTDESFNTYDTGFLDFLLIVLLAPFCETFIFQYMPLKLTSYFYKKKTNVFFYTIIVSSVLFGLMHFKSIQYMLIAFFYGLIWSFSCFIFFRRKQNPFLYTTFIHSIYNFILFVLTVFIGD